ncbi:MAG: hypothetical protein AAEJ46_13420 [Planctomycetota bacterium]
MRSDSSISQCSLEGCVSGIGARWGRFYRVLPFVFLALIGSWIATPAIQGQHPGFVFYFDAEGLVSKDVPVSVRAMLDNSGGPVAGWSVVICHDPQLQVVSAEHGESALTMNGGGPADFMVIHFTPDEGVRQGVVVDFTGIDMLWPEQAHELFLIEYELLELPTTPITISFCEHIFVGDTSGSETLAVAPGGIVIEAIRSPALLHAPQPFIRGDANGDARVDLSDGVALLQITLGGDPSGCADAYDYNDDGQVNLADAISALQGAFGNGPLPPLPGHIDCGDDPTDDSLGCESFSVCP